MSKFNLTHLHLHTDSSFLDGVGRPDEYAALAKKYGMKAVAITDHGNLHGLPSFRRAMKAEGIKPIYGCEFYLNAKREEAKEIKSKTSGAQASGFDPLLRNHHQLLIAMNREGWQNLLKLNHDAIRNGYYYYPRTTVDHVLENSAGLICTTTCTTSIFSRLIVAKKLNECRKMIARYKEAFGDRFYFELQPWAYDEQRAVNEFLVSEMIKQKVEPVLTCDVHYALNTDKDRQDEALCIATGKTLSDPNRFSISTNNFFYSAEEAVDLYASNNQPGGREMAIRACRNTEAIADRCDADIYSDDLLKPPIYRNASGEPTKDAFAELKMQAIAGFKKNILPKIEKSKIQIYKDRLIHELKIIRRCEMSNFYLVTMDVVQECLRREILVWVRGSGCASLVAACLQITRQDPIRYSLLFERFIDPSRPNAPDFDLDIDSTRRHEIVEFVTTKYGGDGGQNIARIVAIQTYGLKAAIQRVLKAHEVDSSIAWKLSDVAAIVTHDKKIESSLASCKPGERRKIWDHAIDRICEASPKNIADWVRSHTDIMEGALCMVGRRYGRSKHAAGYVITPTPIIEHLPVDRIYDDSIKEHIITTAWGEGQASSDISPTGLMKLDLLGLDTITVVSRTIQMASKRHKRNVLLEVDSWQMDFADPKVAKEFASGRGMGLHQLSEVDQGLAKFSAELKPTRVEDVTAMVAMYRPGSIEFLEQYKRRAHGRESAESIHPIYDEIVAETYGIVVYQEQIMHILNRIGSIPLREAYGVIKAIGKKKDADIRSARNQFIEGAKKHDISNKDSSEIFDLIEKFAGYGFNKAHAASYAELSWITAYLRANYRLEFYSCLLNSTPNKKKKKKGMDQDRKVEVVMRQAQASGIRILPPAIGLSAGSWKLSKSGGLIAPLSVISQVGEGAADAINDAWKKHKWATIFDFLEWCQSNKSVVNSQALKLMARGGAFKTFRMSPSQSFDIVRAWSEYKPSKKKGTQIEQLKAALAEDGSEIYRTIDEPDIRLFFEREAIGFAFWCNPWNLMGRSEKIVNLIDSGKILSHTDKKFRDKRRPFLVTNIRNHTDKNGGKMAFLTLAAIDGTNAKGVAFSRTWARCNSVKVDGIYLTAGSYDSKGDYMIADVKRPFISIDSISPE